jgi:hypothetical protein
MFLITDQGPAKRFRCLPKLLHDDSPTIFITFDDIMDWWHSNVSPHDNWCTVRSSGRCWVLTHPNLYWHVSRGLWDDDGIY